MTLEEFTHNELLVAIMTEYLKISDEENASLSIINLYHEYNTMYESGNIGELFEICELAITFHGAILGRVV